MIPDYMLAFANHLWQSTLFMIAVWLMILMLRKNRASLRHRLWLAASVKFLVPFSLLAGFGSYLHWNRPSLAPPVRLSVVVETISEPFSTSAPSVISTATITATPERRSSAVRIGLISVWICGAAASVLLWFIGWSRVWRSLRLATPANLNAPIRVMYSSEHFEPGVFGILNPVLLLPAAIDQHLSPAQIEAVLAHELCHVRRRDNMAMAMHMIVEALFWFHPLVWWIRLRLIEEQELACDEEVLRNGTEPAVYAESLLKVCEFYVELPSMCVSGITGQNLRKRVGRIVRNQIGQNLNAWQKILLTAASVAALVTPVISGVATASPKPAKQSENRQASFTPSVASPLIPTQPSVPSTPRPVVAAAAVPLKSTAVAPSHSAQQQDLRFLSEANYFQLNRAEYFVAVTLKIPSAQFGSVDRILVDVLVEVTDAFGTPIQNLKDSLDVRRDKKAKDVSTQQIVYEAGFTLLPGPYSVKFLLRDVNSDRTGGQETALVIPNLSREAQNLPISSVVLSTELTNVGGGASTELAPRSSAAGGQLTNPLMIEGKKLIPSVTREFSRSRDLIVFLQAYEPNTTATEPLTALVTFYRGQTPVFETPPLTVKDDLGGKLRTLPVALRIPVASLPAGAYDCEVSVLNPATQKSAKWRSPITVVN